MKVFLSLLSLGHSLRFQNDTLGSQLKVVTDTDATITESWCMQFPYCPAGCSLFCTPTAPTIPAAIPAAAAIVATKSVRKGQKRHHKHHRRRRKTSDTSATITASPAQKANVVTVSVAFFLNPAAGASLTRAELSLLNNNAAFRASVKVDLCTKLSVRTPPRSCTAKEAEDSIVNLITSATAAAGFIQLDALGDRKATGDIEFKTLFDFSNLVRDANGEVTVTDSAAWKTQKDHIKTKMAEIQGAAAGAEDSTNTDLMSKIIRQIEVVFPAKMNQAKAIAELKRLIATKTATDSMADLSPVPVDKTAVIVAKEVVKDGKVTIHASGKITTEAATEAPSPAAEDSAGS